METIQVSIVEDVAEIRDGLRFIINQSAGFTCLSTYSNAEDAYEGLVQQVPHIAIMDISLPGANGVDCIRLLKAQGSDIRFLVFTIYEDGEQVFDALAAGASGYLLKNASPAKIIESLRELYDGGAPMSTSIARKVVSSFQVTPERNKLSTREQEILQLLAKGFLYKEIAEQLYIGIGTVRQHVHHIYEKLHVQNRTEALNKVYGRNMLLSDLHGSHRQ